MRNGLVVLTMLFMLSCTDQEQAMRPGLRVATFNIAMGLNKADALQVNLLSGEDINLKKVAAIIQTVRPDILLLNEFDYQGGIDSAGLFNKNYLNVSQFGGKPIDYPWTHAGHVNTGEPSGLDLDQNGKIDDAADSWGFGFFPGQYGMALFSAHPINTDSIRKFRKFRWKLMPRAKLPVDPVTGDNWYPPEIASKLRLSSKDHWDIPVSISDQVIHVVAFHPTPPVFDGAEDRNGLRNHDEIRLAADYVSADRAYYIVDDAGQSGGLEAGADFVILGDMNADPLDGDSTENPIQQFLSHAGINATCDPASEGAGLAALMQGGLNKQHLGKSSLDTSDFNDETVGNLRLDYVLPSIDLLVTGCGVFWPVAGKLGADWIDASDHRLVWADIEF